MQYKNSLKHVVLPIILAIVLIVGFQLGRLGVPGISDSPGSRLLIYPQNNKMDMLLNLIEEEYVDTIYKSELIEKVIPEILKHLDPHTVYIPAEDLATANQELEGNFGGIGVQFSMQNDTVLVISVVSGGPSEKLGIIPGDRIITVNDSIIAGVNMGSDSVVRLLRGEMGTNVRVGVLRRGRNDLVNFDITRGIIPVYSVDVSYMVEDSIGYIRISRFARNTHQEFITAMARLQAHGARSVIVDLRGNSGGYLDVAISICNEFLSRGDLIVYTEGRSSPRQDVHANGTGAFQDMGVTILIDEFSASASEILAGAIQDNDRGLIVGRRSFGKGLVQQQIPLPGGSAIRLSVARYYTPSGRSIQKSYDVSFEEYHRDILTRFEHGEFFERDSIVTDPARRYKTRGGRAIYGGGGVMPDIFVPRDTTEFSDYFFNLRDQGIIYRFALQYTDDNRAELQKFNSVDALEEHLANQPLTRQLVRFASQQGITFNEQQYRISQRRINIEVKALIARNLFDNEGFFPIFNSIDEMVLAAIEETRAAKEIAIPRN